MKRRLMEKHESRLVSLPVSSIDETKISLFVLNHPSGNIFQTISMYRLYQSVKEYQPNYIAVVDECGDIRGLMLSCIIGETGIRSVFSARSIITGGPLVREDEGRATDLLLENYIRYIKNKAIYSQCRNIYPTDSFRKSFALKGFSYKEHFTIIVDLNKAVSELFRSVHKKKRNNIRRASKKGVYFRKLTSPEEIQKAIDLIELTYRRIRLPGPPRALLENAEKFLKEQIHFFGAFFGNEAVAVKVSLSYKSGMYDWYSGYNSRYSYLCANDALTWNSLLWAKGAGLETYDMGGAGRPGEHYGVRNFKIRFGGRLQDTGRFIRIHKPLLYLAGSSFIHLRTKL